jgi:hypothetical protein
MAWHIRAQPIGQPLFAIQIVNAVSGAAVANGQLPEADLHRAMHLQWKAGCWANSGALPFDKTGLASQP